MVQRPPDDADATGEEEALEFDGSATDQLDDTYRLRVVAASESASGTVGLDDGRRSQGQWTTEVSPAGVDSSGTFDQLEALENPALSLEGNATPDPQAPAETGNDPSPTDAFPKPELGP